MRHSVIIAHCAVVSVLSVKKRLTLLLITSLFTIYCYGDACVCVVPSTVWSSAGVQLSV